MAAQTKQGARWVVILGAGFVGSRLATALESNEAARQADPALRRRVLATHRSDFSLQDKESWARLPPTHEVDAVVVTFPCTPLEAVKELHSEYLSKVKRVVVYGSTSRYIVDQPDEEVTEEAKVDLTQGRVEGEEYLREHGATCLVLAGIYGDERQPSSWLLRGLIKNGNKHVNLVHVSDIVAATVRVLESEEDLSGQSVNVSDGVPRRWHDILAHYRTTGAVPADREITFPDQSPPDTQSKRISNAKLRRLLPPTHHFVDLFAQ